MTKDMTKDIEGNLNYLLAECLPDEYNPELAAAYINLLKELRPNLKEPKTLELPDDNIHKIYISPASTTHTKKVTLIGIATAACIATMLIGIDKSAIATHKQGYFYWLKRDEHGVTFITNPESLNTAAEQSNYSQSYKPDDVPEKYKEYVIDAEVIAAIENLKDFELQEVNIIEEGNIESVDSCLINQGTEEQLNIDIAIFPDKRLWVDESYSDSDYEYSVVHGEIEYKLFSKPNPTRGTDYAVIFYFENKKYTLSNHDDSQQLIEIAIQYYQYICSV